MVAAWPQILSNGDVVSRLRGLAAVLGFHGASTLDAVTRQAIGVPEEFDRAVMARGTGTTRFLGVVSQSEAPREEVVRVAGRLARKAPHMLWLLAVSTDQGDLVLAAWHATSEQPRIAALVIHTGALLPSDIDSLESIRITLGGRLDLEIHALWLEVLGRESISRRFFQTLQRMVIQLSDGAGEDHPSVVRREIALLTVSRLLFLAFLEERGWLDGDRRFLARTFDECMARGGRFQRSGLAPLFFGTLNTPVRRRAPRARALGTIPFLMLTAEAYRENVQQAMSAGVTDYISKPFTAGVLVEKLEAMLGGARS